ncbi:MAG: hypothetical protein F6K09_10410 [Merismopedia sp. SIO2A8]|nr:hypothetical protein [Merismopedia sp. SIO2A8]
MAIAPQSPLSDRTMQDPRKKRSPPILVVRSHHNLRRNLQTSQPFPKLPY